MMAQSIDSGLLDPIAAVRRQQMNEHKARSHLEAEKVEKEIYGKLRRDGLPVPPYSLKDFIGKGTYGRVFKADDLENHREVAIKMMEIDQVDYEANGEHMNQSMEDLKREVDVLTHLSRAKAPNINAIYDVLPILGQIWIICEYCPGGSVRTLMRATESKLEERYIKVIARELAIGLNAIHHANIMHRDIKPANVMIHENGNLQIIDFGVANVLQSKVDKRGTIIGTPHQMAPELHKRHGAEGLKYGFEIDVWAYAATLFELATGRPPHARTMPGLYLGTQLSREPPRLDKETFSLELCQFVEYVAQVRPEKRPSMEQILEHPYVSDSADQYPTSILSELVQIFTQWSYTGGQRTSLFMDTGASAPANYDEVAKAEEWRFSTFLDSSPGLDQTQDTLATASASQAVPSLQIDSPEGLKSGESFGGRRPYSPSLQARDDYGTSLEGKPDAVTQDTIGRRPSTQEENRNVTSKVSSLDDPHTEKRIQRGANALANIFGGEQEYRYDIGNGQASTDPPSLSRAKSDLPLRNISDFSDAKPKDVYTSHGEVRTAATGIALADANTIKQRQRQPKRDTMAWEPEYITTPSNPMDWEPDYSSATEDERTLAPTITFERPSLPHSNTAPIHISTARASTASVLDMDALLGEEFQPTTAFNSYTSKSNYAEPASPSDEVTIAPARSRISTVGGHDLDMYNAITDTSDDEEIGAQLRRHTGQYSISTTIENASIHTSPRDDDQDIGDTFSPSLQDMIQSPQDIEDTTRMLRAIPDELGSEQIDTALDSFIHPPGARVMSGQASQEEVAGELTRMMSSMLAELRAFKEEVQDSQAGNEGYDGDDDSDALIGSGIVNGLGIGGT